MTNPSTDFRNPQAIPPAAMGCSKRRDSIDSTGKRIFASRGA
jgi:hypothetical protein